MISILMKTTRTAPERDTTAFRRRNIGYDPLGRLKEIKKFKLSHDDRVPLKEKKGSKKVYRA
jgi:hypothetical protein